MVFIPVMKTFEINLVSIDLLKEHKEGFNINNKNNGTNLYSKATLQSLGAYNHV